MKQNRLFLSAVWSCFFAFAACTQSELFEDKALGEPGESVPFVVGIGTLDTKTAKDVLGSGEFSEGDCFGLFVRKEGAAGFVYNNIPYVLTAGKWGPQSGSSVDSLYWNLIGIDKPHSFMAYYPQQLVRNPQQHPFAVQADQQVSQAAYTNSDLLHAITTAQGGAVDLRFRHAMSCLLIQVMSDKIVSVKLKQLKINCTVDLLTGETLSATVSTDLLLPRQWVPVADLPASIAPAGTQSVYTAIVPAQQFTNTVGNRYLLFEVATSLGTTVVASAPLEIETPHGVKIPFNSLEANKQTVLRLDLSGDTVTVTSAAVQPWSVGGTTVVDSRSYVGVASVQDFLDLAEYTQKYGSTLPPGIKERFVREGTNTIYLLNDLIFDAETSAKYMTLKGLSHELNGQGHTIKGLANKPISNGYLNCREIVFENCSYNTWYRGGLLINGVNNGIVKNCVLRNCYLGGVSSGLGGLIVGHTNNIEIDSVFVYDSSVSGTKNMGILVGNLGYGSIKNSAVVNCTVGGGNACGALVGECFRSGFPVENCYSINNTLSFGSKQNGNGLLVGTANFNVKNCYAIGKVKGPLFGDGVTGTATNVFYAEGSSIQNTPNVSLQKSNIYSFNLLSGTLIDRPVDYPANLTKALNEFAQKNPLYAKWKEYWMKLTLPSGATSETNLPMFLP